jgi:predicted nucleic acid-binding protein
VTRAFLDANVFVYAVGADHEYREPCRAIVKDVRDGRLEGESSVEVIQEAVHILRRKGRSDATVLGREFMAVCHKLHSIERSDLTLALELLEKQEELDTRDGVHAAVALNRRIAVILSADRRFEEISGLERIDPQDRRRVERLWT